MTGRDYDAILALPLPEHTGADTIGEFFAESLRALWQEGDSFSGKRPLGNSGWRWDIAAPLVEHGHVEGRFIARGGGFPELEEVDWPAANELINAAIRHVFRTTPEAGQ